MHAAGQHVVICQARVLRADTKPISCRNVATIGFSAVSAVTQCTAPSLESEKSRERNTEEKQVEREGGLRPSSLLLCVIERTVKPGL